MFVNKISGVSPRLSFRGPQHVINSVGKQVELFGYPYDNETETCEIEFARAKKNEKYNIIVDEASKRTVQLKPEGLEIDPKELLNLDEGEAYVYKIRIKEKSTGKVKWEGADTGVKLKQSDSGEWVFRISDGQFTKNVYDDKNKKLYEYQTSTYSDMLDKDGNPVNPYQWTLVTTIGTTPMSNGAGYLVMADSLLPGAKIRGFDDPNCGEVYFDEKSQEKAEKSLRTFSNIMGGGIAGLISVIPYLKANGYSMMFGLPIANGDDVSSHSYWNKNNFQIASKMGTTEDFSQLLRELYKNGMQYVYDGTYTSEGLEGIHFQYALRWAQNNPQTYYWFRMQGLKNSNLGLGVVPENAKNLSHRVINAPYKYEKQPDGTYKKLENKQYNPNKETLFQIFDASQVSEEQKNALDKQIRIYENITSGNPMDINTHDDTVIAYAFQINPNEYEDRINTINDLIKSGRKIDLFAEDGTILAGQFSNFKIDKKTEGGFVTWDANTDMAKMNYGVSGYDLKNLKAITDRAERYYEQQLMERGAIEVTDMAVQNGRYWTRFARNVQTLYNAKVIGLSKTPEDLEKLVEQGLLPEKGKLTSEEIRNILNGEYIFRSPKGVLSRDDVTVKNLMELPLDSLVFGENTAGVLSTSYFSNRATTDKTIGKTRFELLKANNPHLIDDYANVYNKVNSMFTGEIKDFADKIIEKVNEASNEKLLDAAGNYTEYGEYVVELIAPEIAKYAFLKSLAGDSFRAKVNVNGDLTFDYDKIKENTTLKALGINASNPEEEAEILQKKMKNGLKSLNDDDIKVVSDYILNQRIKNSDTMTFRLAEAWQNKEAKGLAFRLDAAKDIKDQDAVRNKENDFDDTWDSMIKFWQHFVKAVKSENPNAYLVAEITDVGDLLRDTYGAKSNPYDGNTNINNCKFNGDNDAQTKFFTETGITSEAAYSYLFTNLLVNFSGEFESGKYGGGEKHDDFKRRIDYLMQTRSADYMRNLYTFIGNHDKTRTIQGLATDMRLFQSPISYTYEKNGKINFEEESDQRAKVIQVLSGVTNPAAVPIELRLNVDNMDYFRTISPKAVSQAKTLLLPIQEDLKGIATEEEIKILTNAVIDLANGNYRVDKQTKPMTRINIPEISTTEKAINQILDMAEKHGYSITGRARESLVNSLVKQINKTDLSNYQVHGDFDWGEPNEEVGQKNKDYLKEILGTSDDGKEYSLYTVQLARLIKQSYKDVQGNNKYENPALDAALKDFISKYNRQMVEEHTAEAVKMEAREITRNKDSFGVKPFENVMDWVINQAEFKSGKTFANRQAIIDRVVTSVTEPAIQKQAMMMTYLKGLIGIPTIFAGDEYGASGYEDKAKNKYLAPRNTVNRSGINAERYSKITNETIRDRARFDLHSLNDGTLYSMDVMASGKNRDGIKERLAQIGKALKSVTKNSKEEKLLQEEQRQLTKELAKVAYMMHSSNGDAVVSVFSAQDINYSNRFDYFKYLADEYGIDTEEKRKKAFADGTIYSINPENKYVPVQHKTEMDAILLGAGISIPIGTLFMNADARDKVEYVVKNINGKLGIARKDGKKIIMDGKTAKNGVMLLKKMKNIIFRGGNINTQYNLASNPYKKTEVAEEGKKLSLIAK